MDDDSLGFRLWAREAFIMIEGNIGSIEHGVYPIFIIFWRSLLFLTLISDEFFCFQVSLGVKNRSIAITSLIGHRIAFRSAPYSWVFVAFVKDRKIVSLFSGWLHCDPQDKNALIELNWSGCLCLEVKFSERVFGNWHKIDKDIFSN